MSLLVLVLWQNDGAVPSISSSPSILPLNPRDRETEQDKVYFWKTLKVNQVPEHLQKLPITPSVGFPQVKARFPPETSTSAASARNLSDELITVSGSGRDTFRRWTARLVDSLVTLWVMDIKDEFSDAVAAAVTIDFTKTDWKETNVFATNIRYLGGFLSAFDLSSDL
ncbi:mannosyl-oligosaccharide alpha-1,2-mannosidase 1B [Colletotrichum liriopes]|uniref:alpha-1,2-Mannosidase n=1 Tax=Colletotrichum liriopes TaxID=708192 RepID=A0AA37GB74_9PEZI|nr:mannosyl-oligosaccharide alpha-1,2-mannosidase 1B [Colletotrichum liriopes]